ncbi:MAG: hypothetical protein SAJ12_03275 [Jaaginema sp. PMC 1079.18]|nr:hypothetical protein [Jaaginema sp. PMC 1080.18]MEC4850009.1 hypothetical protein [Jaaginema sp. PMC 1079.18]MEC4865932.1 hypothetical protein [Jaaginema sp. PMC 1078.18]
MVWFDALREGLILTEADWRSLSVSLLTALQQHDFEVKLPDHLQSDVAPRIVFLSVSDPAGIRVAARVTPAFVARGKGLGLARAINTALERLIRNFSPDYTPQWLKIDIVQEAISSVRLNSDRPLGFERSLQGLAFAEESAIAFLPEELVTHSLVLQNQTLHPGNIIKYLEKQPGSQQAFEKMTQAKSYKVYRFICSSFFTDGTETVNLYRGHRLFNDFSKEMVLEGAIAAGEYLKPKIDTEGKFIYCYHAKTDKIIPKYNILRHSGTIYALLELFEVTEDKDLLTAIQRAIAYLLQQIQSATAISATGEGDCVVEAGEVKLGGNALAAIALAKYTEITQDTQYLPTIINLCRWIESVQDETGQFLIHKQAQDQEPDDFRSSYYPGEAILALVRLHALTQDQHWLDIAEKAAKYRINKHNNSPKAVPQDHWFLYALNELFRQRQVPVYLTYAGRIADAMIQSQQIDPMYPDWLGCFQEPPRSTPTATRTEGLCAAYRLAQFSGNSSQLQQILEAIVLGVAFQLQTQIRPEIALYYPNASRSLGGFRKSLTHSEIRIDYVQHNISSLLGLYAIAAEQRQAWEAQQT